MRKVLFLVFLSLLVAGGVAQAAQKKLKVGFVYVSPVGDAGWSYAHDVARQALGNLPDVDVKYLEAVKEGADSERVFLNMARKKYDVVFGTSFGYMDPMLKVSKKFPKTVFMHCSGYKTSKNMGNYFGRMYQARYLSGMVAGSMTKSNVLGYVAAFPIPEVIRGINAFTLGVKAVNPKAEVRVVWTKTWYDPAKEKEGAKSLLDIGADVIAQHQDSPGPQEAAQERGAYSVGYNTDMSSFAPKSHLVAPIWNWTPFYMDVINSVKEGSWKSGSSWNGLAEGVVDLSPMGSMVPDTVKEKVFACRDEIKKGSLVVFAGPVKDQAGVVRIAKGAKASDGELLGMDWFVQGVVGTTE
ncbi:MAG: BMP family ABC transporter substrate-binding protein [Desulfobacterales bacterium]|nr:BMP family ABC transporter substrate-binding protein [Desulfobacterales bacterium]